MTFSHLHNHTQFSLLDGASPIPRLFDKAAKDGMPAVAITDHGNMFGVFQFVAQAWNNTKVVGKTEGGKEIHEPVVKPIVGCEFYLVEDRMKRSFTRTEKDQRYHQLFLAKDEIGYKNLVKLCSLGYLEGLYGKYPRIDKELVLKHHEGLIATTCCIGAEVPKTILKHGEQEAEKVFKWWLDLFGDDYYVELQRHDIPEQIKVNEVLMRFAKKYNVPVIASNDSHYVDQADYNAHDILLCINTNEKQSTPSNKEFQADQEEGNRNTRFAFYNDQFYFKTTSEMKQLFDDLPQAIENTQLIVDKVKPLDLKKDILLPHFKVPLEFNNDQDAYLAHLTWMGAKERYKELTSEIEQRIQYELDIIRTMGFAGYFLIVSDFIKAGRDLGVFIGPGRGSAAGSVVAYCTGITNIDPIKYNLLFERFLNPERKSMPDIDTDFDDEGRQKVIDYVVDKYGKEQVAHIITYGTMAARMSIKDVARVLDLPLSSANDLARLVPDKPGISLKRILHAPIDKSTEDTKSLKEKEELREDDLQKVQRLRELYEKEESMESKVLHEAEKLEGSVRNTGIHAAGIIIAPTHLSELLPVCVSKDVSLLITQYEGNTIEDAGVIKMDFLGLKTLSILRDALALIKKNHNIDIILDEIPLNDSKTFELYQKGSTIGTFQFESPGMQKYLRDLKPDKLEDLIAMNALFRPGPMEYIPMFIKRKHGAEEIVYDLPEQEEYLQETFGITVYQEQVMLLSQKIGGFSKGEADNLRKAMGKKKRSDLDKMKLTFMQRATAKGHPEKELEKIWTDWEAFAQYAFNKSHSTCYAFVAYQTAFLKANYPGEFMAALLNNTNNTEKISTFMRESQSMGLQVLGPNVNESQKGFSVKEGIIRFGLNAIKGVGENAVDEIIAEREKGGQFTDVMDFVQRVNLKAVNKKSMECMVKAGAFECFPQLHRAQYFASVPSEQINVLEMLLRFGNQVQGSKNMVANSLFGEMTMPAIKPPAIPPAEEWPLPQLLEQEKEMVGLYLSAHPLDSYAFEMEHFRFCPIYRLPECVGKQVELAGYFSEVNILHTKKGDRYARVKLTDYSDTLELFLWKDNFLRFENMLHYCNTVVVTGVYEESRFRTDQMEFKPSRMVLMSSLRDHFVKRIVISAKLEAINFEFYKQMEAQVNYPGNTIVELVVLDPERNFKVPLRSMKMRVNLQDEFLSYLDKLTDVHYSIDTARSN